jgi:WXXGXW repeat (2 copies)
MTRRVRRAALMAAGLAGAGVLGGCAVSGRCPEAPAVQAETIPPPRPSGEQQRWQPGHWSYQSSQFVWEPGQYILLEPGQNGWLPGAFAPGSAGDCTWVPAHWVS